jgi:hypothetical protein
VTIEAASGEVVIKMLPWMRRAFLGFFLVWCGVLVAVAIGSAAHRAAGAAIVPVIMIAVGLWAAGRFRRISVTLRADELVTRNFRTVKRLRRADIEGFRVGPTPRQAASFCVWALTNDTQMTALDATQRFGRIARHQNPPVLATLQAWLNES